MHSDLKALEFDGVRRLLERLTFTPYGAEAARNLEPAPTIAIAREMQQSVSAARRIVDEYLLPKVGTVADVRPAFRQAGQPGAALAASALNNIRLVLKLAETLRELLSRFPMLYRSADALTAAPAVIELIDRTVSPAGRLREDASAELTTLHTHYNEARSEVERKLLAVMRAPENAALFDEKSKPTWQGTRAVLALRQTHADSIKGVRRGTAGGGRDVLIEPIDTVALNNRLETLSGQIDLQNQIVLRHITDTLRGHLPSLQQLVDGIMWIDLALAAGQLSAAMNAAAPELCDEPVVALAQAYHPQLLLQFQDRHISQIKALDIDLNLPRPMMVITGPNTGGKTVVLKTVGLLATMAHCGLHLPSEGLCRIGNFDRIVVDVGDKQSLYHHLSTFAGHVEVLKRLLDEASERTLVLLDELGTGTDPEEGAALAMAVLDELASRRVFGIVTTHLSPLKTFAAESDYLCNASMRFDYATLSPTYELDVGEAGRSLGLIIAEKNGLPTPLINRARAHLERLAAK